VQTKFVSNAKIEGMTKDQIITSWILPIAAQVKSAEATPIKTFLAFPCYGREAGQVHLR